MDINNVNLIGRLTRNIELRYTNSGIACTTFDIAVGNGKDKEGKEIEADFLRIVAWGKLAENLAKYCGKGSQVAIEGRLKTNSYTDKNGNKKYETFVRANQIEFIGTRKTQEPLPEIPTTPQKPQFAPDILSEEDYPF